MVSGIPGTQTHSILFFRRGSVSSVVKAAALVVHLFKDDTRILQHFHMQEAFTASDAPVRACGRS